MIPKKHLGQHFLTAPSYARRIAERVPAGDRDLVLEIGPGQGALTVFLARRFPRLHLAEIDSQAIEVLRTRMAGHSCTIHHVDVLSLDFGQIGFPLHVVGNLPYSIGALIIKKTLLYGNGIKSCTFMVQREVARRIVAEPHCRDFGYLSVFCAFFGTARLLFHVPPGAFFPAPKVFSSVFQIMINDNLAEKLSPELWDRFFAVVSKAFQQRRKKVVNALAGDLLPKETITERLEKLGYDPAARPEDLNCSQWLELFKSL